MAVGEEDFPSSSLRDYSFVAPINIRRQNLLESEVTEKVKMNMAVATAGNSYQP